MASRLRCRPFAVEVLEERVVLSVASAAHVKVLHATATTLVSVGALGDSYTDEYRFYRPDQSKARNWVEILADTHRVSFGAFTTTSRGEPRDQGFAQNWALCRADVERHGCQSAPRPGNRHAGRQRTGPIRMDLCGQQRPTLYFLQGAETSSESQLPGLEATLTQLTATRRGKLHRRREHVAGRQPQRPPRGCRPCPTSLSCRPSPTPPQATPRHVGVALGDEPGNYPVQQPDTQHGHREPRMRLVDLASASSSLESLSATSGSRFPIGGNNDKPEDPRRQLPPLLPRRWDPHRHSWSRNHRRSVRPGGRPTVRCDARPLQRGPDRQLREPHHTGYAVGTGWKPVDDLVTMYRSSATEETTTLCDLPGPLARRSPNWESSSVRFPTSWTCGRDL